MEMSIRHNCATFAIPSKNTDKETLELYLKMPENSLMVVGIKLEYRSWNEAIKYKQF